MKLPVKVICINKSGYELIVGKEYEVIGMYGDFYEINHTENDYRLRRYPKSLFVDIVEYRNIKINNILKN